MKRTFKLLVLTDHQHHSRENSLYALVRMMQQADFCSQIDVATRHLTINDYFFKDQNTDQLYACPATEFFSFHPDGKELKSNLLRVSVKEYDAIWLRLPPPLSKEFLDFLSASFPQQIIINDPNGIYKAGSKEFLLNFSTCCPPMKVCRSIDDIIEFKHQFPIVLKPFREYGGKGILKIDGDTVWEGNQSFSFASFKEQIANQKIEFLGVQFLKNVSQGDKRIIVVNGEILGASLRLPAENSWLCNVAMGGHSILSKVDEAERAIVQQIHPILTEMGILMYGVDTLMGNEGKRVLSEINTTSIGGLPQIAEQTGKPLVKRTIQLIGEYILQKMNENARTAAFK